jgi:hypothetical protein
MMWSTYIGGSRDDRGRASVVDAAGNIYILAQTQSSDVSTTAGVFKPVFTPAASNDQDALLAKFDSSGHRIWTTYFGGTGNEQPKSLKTDRFGSFFYISGSTKSKAGLATNDAYQKKMGGANDAFFARINHDASALMYSSYYGGKKSESDFNGTWYGAPLEIDHQGNLILASATQSSDSIVFGNPYQGSISSDTAYDFFIVKFLETCFDSYEGNDNIADAPPLFYDGISNSRMVKGTLQSSSDADYYQFSLPDGLSNIRCTVSGLSAQYSVTIYNADQVPVATTSAPRAVME